MKTEHVVAFSISFVLGAFFIAAAIKYQADSSRYSIAATDKYAYTVDKKTGEVFFIHYRTKTQTKMSYSE